MGKEYVQGKLFILELSEDEWYWKPDEEQATLKELAIRGAEINKCNIATVMVVPDPLFSVCGRDKKHRVFEKSIELRKPVIEIGMLVTATIDVDAWLNASEMARQKMRSAARDEANRYARGVSGRYVIVLSDGRKLEGGRV